MISDKFILNYKNCRKVQDGWLFEPKRSNLILNNIESNNITLILKKVSGNGKVLFRIDDKEIHETIFSKNKKSFSFSNFEKIEISRPKDSVGQIILLDLIEKENTLNLKLKNIFSKLEYSGLRFVGSDIRATAGAWLASKYIKDVCTIPEGIFKKEDDKYKFISSGIITDISLFENISIQNKKSEFDKLNFPKLESNKADEVLPKKQLTKINITKKQANDNIIFDSDIANIFSVHSFVKSKFSKIVNSNGKNFLILKRFGIFSQPICNLNPGQEYIISVYGKKINGNGKVKISFNGENSSQINFDNNFSNKIIKLFAKNKNDRLDICISEDGIGEIIISKIIVKLFDSSLLSQTESLNKEDNFSYISDVVDDREQLYDSFIENFNNISYKDIRRISKDFAFIDKSIFSFDKKINEKNNILISSYGPRQWLSKIISLFNNIKILDPFLLFESSEFNNFIHNTDIHFSILSANNLNYVYGNVFLEETPDNYKFTNEQIKKLSISKKIITPSVFDLIKLKSLLPNVPIEIGAKYWPILNIEKNINKNNSCIYFEKNISFTQELVNLWKKDYPKLYIVGANIDVINHNNIEHISEYCSYQDLYEYILQSEILIDYGDNTNYNSGIINLFYNLNKKIITNNSYYIMNNDLNFLQKIKFKSNFNLVFEETMKHSKNEKHNFNSYQEFLNMIGAK